MIGRSFIFGLCIGLLGCQDEGIRVLHVAKPPPKRTLAFIIPRPDATWFLKLNGPADAVTIDAPAFREFGTSIQFINGEPPIRYAVPPSWRSQDTQPGGMFKRYATFHTENNCEVIVTQLGPGSGEVLPNVNRWRGEVGLGSVTESELGQIVEPIEIAGAKATFVNVDGQPLTRSKHAGGT
jgi:hypothetical protein